ncbi:MAG: malonate decarboxylase holo-[acyl-carrier-protein] synthase [Proteobacteria bacterium]|nr:malonate decarboxylase holo-[acyl-carrier-protein] synthase [Pseudomonadota bacterium]
MRRHDLATVRAGAPVRFLCGALDDALSARVAAWIAAGRSLVVARQLTGGSEALLGLTLPAAEGRRRVGCLVEQTDLLQIRRPLSIAECLHRLADDVAAPLATLAERLAAAGVSVGVYGSLAWEALSGEAYRHPESDVDLICDVASAAQAEACLRLLADGAAALPCGLDGEIRFPDGCAVAWRELAAAWSRADAKVLVKGGVDVGLLPLSVVLEQFEEDALHV